MSSKFKITISVILALIIGFGVGSSVVEAPRQTTSPLSSEKQEKPKISIMIDFENGKINTINDVEIKENVNLLNIMKNALAAANIPFEYKEYSGLGALVTKIDDKSNGTGNSYWQYWVNNKRPDVGASSYQLKNGDVIEWKFLPDQGF